MAANNRKRRKWAVGLAVAALLAAYVGWHVCSAYSSLFMAASAEPPYPISPKADDDTLRIAVIGDSWAEYHHSLGCDTMLVSMAQRLTARPVACRSRGKGGAKSKEIYHMMFQRLTEENPFESDRCTQPLLESHPDYCVVFAGINDVVHKRNAAYYAGNMQQIVRLLLQLGIRPVVMEIPTVDYPEIIRRKSWHQRLLYAAASMLPGAGGTSAKSHRQALTDMLRKSNLADSVLYIPCNAWNGEGLSDERGIHTDDRVHLNLTGYHILDSCIATNIAADYAARHEN